MIAFEIAVDGQKTCTAGVAHEGVTSVIASWVRRPSLDPTTDEAIPGRFEEELTLWMPAGSRVTRMARRFAWDGFDTP